MQDTLKSENWYHGFDLHGWQEVCHLPKSTFTNPYQYRAVIEWLYDNVRNTESNVLWSFAGGDTPAFRFRKAKDQTFFLLRWA